MKETAQDRGQNCQDEEAERTSEDVEDETVFCALTAFLGMKFIQRNTQMSAEACNRQNYPLKWEFTPDVCQACTTQTITNGFHQVFSFSQERKMNKHY